MCFNCHLRLNRICDLAKMLSLMAFSAKEYSNIWACARHWISIRLPKKRKNEIIKRQQKLDYCSMLLQRNTKKHFIFEVTVDESHPARSHTTHTHEKLLFFIRAKFAAAHYSNYGYVTIVQRIHDQIINIKKLHNVKYSLSFSVGIADSGAQQQHTAQSIWVGW